MAVHLEGGVLQWDPGGELYTMFTLKVCETERRKISTKQRMKEDIQVGFEVTT
jgi:hypothetical protein